MADKSKPDPKKTNDNHDDDDFILKATVIGVDPGIEPIRSVVVGDNRNRLGRRLGGLALVILVLFFLINGYIQSSRNGQELKIAKNDRGTLIHSVDGLSQTIRDQDHLIQALQNALREQNKTLRKAGFKTVHIPGTSTPSTSGSSSSHSHPQPSGHSPQPRPNSSPSSKPSSKPSQPPPSPDPTQSTKDAVCSLTGICLQSKETNDFQQQAVRPAEVYRAGVAPSDSDAIFRSITDLGTPFWW